MKLTTASPIVIQNNALISQVCEEFQAQYPYLKLVLKKKGKYLSSAQRLVYLHPVPGNTHGLLEIHSSLPVSEMEELFKEYFGIAITVLRRSGNTWLETVKTNTWSLSEQNTEGEYLTLRKK